MLSVETALMGAVSTGHQAVVEVLLNTPDTDLNARDEYGRTALSEAQKRLTHPQVPSDILWHMPGSGPG